jgi:hypothetical protein
MSNIIRTPEQAERREIQLKELWLLRYFKRCKAVVTSYQKSTIERWNYIIAKDSPIYTNTTDSNLDFRERADKITWLDNIKARVLYGWSLKAIVHCEFFEEDFKIKFKNDYQQAQNIIPEKTLAYFRVEEIKRIEEVVWALEICLDRCGQFVEHVTLCNYLKFLKEYEEGDIMNDSDSEPTKTDLICDKKQLQKLHAEFDGKRWENVELETFLDYMRVEPIGQIKIIGGNKKLAIWLRENIENERNVKLVPNMGVWFKKLIGKNINYSTFFQE